MFGYLFVVPGFVMVSLFVLFYMIWIKFQLILFSKLISHHATLRKDESMRALSSSNLGSSQPPLYI